MQRVGSPGPPAASYINGVMLLVDGDAAYQVLLICAEIQQDKAEDLDILTQAKIPTEQKVFVSSGNQFSQSFLKKYVVENLGYDNLKNPFNQQYFSKRDKKTIEDAIQIQVIVTSIHVLLQFHVEQRAFLLNSRKYIRDICAEGILNICYLNEILL